MEHKLEWLAEEEGRIVFSEKNNPFLTVNFYAVGEEEAEFQLQDVVFAENLVKNEDMRGEVILKMTNCVSECFRLLWEEGYEETILVEPQGTKIAEILDSTSVVRLAYSEYMMKRHLEPQKSTDCGQASVKLTKTEDGYYCENADNTFFCRLMRYGADKPGENSFYLYEVEVNKRKRNKGIATACLAKLFQQLAADAPATIYLQVGSYNEPAVHLYQKLGFEISEELCCYVMEEE